MALIALLSAAFMASLDTSIANAGLPVLAGAFGASPRAAQGIVLSYLGAVTSALLVTGRLGDMWGRRRLFIFGTALFTVASLACGIAPSINVLIAARAVQGLGAAAMLSLTLALIREAVPHESAGGAMGWLSAMSAIGTSIGPSVGGLLTSAWGWPSIFLVNVPLGLATIAMAWRSLPADPAEPAGQPSFRFSFRTVPRMLADPALRAPVLSSVLVHAAIMTTLVVGPFVLTAGFGLSTVAAGLGLSLGPIVAAVAGVVAGRVVARFGAERLTRIGATGIAAGALLVAILPRTWGLWAYLVPITVMTAAFGTFQTANNTGVMRRAAASDLGLTAGLLSVARNLGLMIGAAVIGGVFTAAADVWTVVAAMRVAFMLAAAVAFLAAVASTRRRSSIRSATPSARPLLPHPHRPDGPSAPAADSTRGHRHLPTAESL